MLERISPFSDARWSAGDVPKAYQSLSKLTLLAVVWNELTGTSPLFAPPCAYIGMEVWLTWAWLVQ